MYFEQGSIKWILLPMNGFTEEVQPAAKTFSTGRNTEDVGYLPEDRDTNSILNEFQWLGYLQQYLIFPDDRNVDNMIYQYRN